MNNKMSTQDFNEKYSLYKTILFRIAFTYLKNVEDCEDILQEVFVKLLTNTSTFESSEHEKRWLIRVTINLCKNHIKSFWNRNRDDMQELQEFAESKEELGILQEVLALPEKYKIVIYLHYVEGYKCAEIADIIKRKESAVKMRLKKGRELLKMELEA